MNDMNTQRLIEGRQGTSEDIAALPETNKTTVVSKTLN